MEFSDKVRATFSRSPAARAIEFDGVWHNWSELAGIAERLDVMLAAAGVPSDAPVGVIPRNRASHAGALLGLIAARRSFSMVYAFQSPEAKARDIAELRVAALVADAEDWSPELIEAARQAGTVGIALTNNLSDAVALVPGLEKVGSGPFRAPNAEPTIDLLTSGTTGAPKRHAIRFPQLARSVVSTIFEGPDAQDLPPLIVFWPFSHVGGLCNLITCAVSGTPMCLIEKFTIDSFVGMVTRNRPTLITLTPTAVQMIVDAKVPREVFASVTMASGGSARLDPDLQDRFEATYGIPILWGYGATEFCGSVIRWTPEMRTEFGTTKRGSIGRAMPGVDIRAVDAEIGTPVSAGSPGLLEARVPELGPDWIRTTDLVSIDADGFVFHQARNDGAIVRGGFKILPERIVDVLRQYPGIRDAAVVGLDDQRLGQVPAAAIELHDGVVPPDAEELANHVRRHLAATHVPVRFLTVDALPRTPSMKVRLGEVRDLFGT